jgi:hypothetical protein
MQARSSVSAWVARIFESWPRAAGFPEPARRVRKTSSMIDSTTAQLIQENMPVLGSDNGQLAVVDHLEGDNAIKLTKDGTGQHHYIPLAWVTSVDDAVHLDRTGAELMQGWTTSAEDLQVAPEGSGPIKAVSDADIDAYVQAPAAEVSLQPDAPAMVDGHSINSVDATMGKPLVERVQLRKAELEAALAAIPETDIRGREPIELALSTVEGLLTGDLKSIPAVVGKDMNLWLERHKHLAQRAVDAATGAALPATTDAELQAQHAQAAPTPRPLTDDVVAPYVKPADDAPVV